MSRYNHHQSRSAYVLITCYLDTRFNLITTASILEMATDSTPVTYLRDDIHCHQWYMLTLNYSAIMTGLFGVAAVTGLVLFFDEVPRVRKDILQKLPIVGSYFLREIPPEDNPF